MRKLDIWDILFWIGMLVLIGYVIGKLTGLINTPEWIELIPIITIIFVAGVFYQKVVSFMDRMVVRTDYFKKNMDKLTEENKGFDKRIFALEKSQELIFKKLTIKT